MNKPIMLIATVLLIAVCTKNTYSQQKYEKESRIKHRAVPSVAVDFVDALEITGRIKWYSEVGLISKSIEAKFKMDKRRHSVEFDTSGNIQDVEIALKWEELPFLMKDTISSQLSKICSTYKISKIQTQYLGSPSNLLTFLKTATITESLSTNYEIVVKCVNRGKKELFEYLFSEEGKLLATSKIIFKNSSNLEY